MEPAAAKKQLFARLAQKAFETTSVVPLAAFALFHVLDYARVLLGAQVIGERRHPSLARLVLEALLVWLPLAFHAGWALVVYARRRRELEPKPSGRALLAVHRLSGVVAGLFLVDHFVRFRLPILRGESYPSDSILRLAAELSTTRGGFPLTAALHLLGTLAIAFHLAFGLKRVARRSSAYADSRLTQRLCMGAGVVVALAGALTILRLAAGG